MTELNNEIIAHIVFGFLGGLLGSLITLAFIGLVAKIGK